MGLVNGRPFKRADTLFLTAPSWLTKYLESWEWGKGLGADSYQNCTASSTPGQVFRPVAAYTTPMRGRDGRPVLVMFLLVKANE